MWCCNKLRGSNLSMQLAFAHALGNRVLETEILGTKVMRQNFLYFSTCTWCSEVKSAKQGSCLFGQRFIFHLPAQQLSFHPLCVGQVS